MTNTQCPLAAQRLADPANTPACDLHESTEVSGGRSIIQTTCGACGQGGSRIVTPAQPLAEAESNEPPAEALSDQPVAETPAHPRKPKRAFLR